MNDVIFLRDGNETGPRNEPWPHRPYLLVTPAPVLTPRRAAVVIALIVAFTAGYGSGVIATRRAVAVEAEIRR